MLNFWWEGDTLSVPGYVLVIGILLYYIIYLVVTFDEQLFVFVVSDGVPRRRIATTKVQPPGQRPAVVIAAAAKLVVVFQTLDRVAFNLALHDRPVLRLTNRIRTEYATERRRTEDHGTPSHATDDALYRPDRPITLLSFHFYIKKRNCYDKKKTNEI